MKTTTAAHLAPGTKAKLGCNDRLYTVTQVEPTACGRIALRYEGSDGTEFSTSLKPTDTVRI